MIPCVPLEQVAQINPRIPKGIDESQSVSFIAMASVSEGGRVVKQETRVLGETKKGFTYFERGDVLLAKITPCFENGKAALVDCLEHPVGFGSTEFHVLRVDSDRLDAKYLFYMVWSDHFRYLGQNAMQGAAGQKRVSADFLKQFEIPLPPLAEQQRIAAILDKADALRRKRQQAIDLADQFLRSQFLEMFGDPVTNPKGWEIGTIRELVAEAKYGTAAKADVENGKFPILRMGNITYGGGWNLSNLKYVDLPEKDQEKYLVREGDLLFNRTNSKELVGKTAIYDLQEPMAVAGYLIRVRTNEKGNPYYIAGYLNSAHGKSTLVGMCKSIIGMANINAQEMQNIKICLPPFELQCQFENISKSVKTRVGKHQRSLGELCHLFSSLSQQAFQGDL